MDWGATIVFILSIIGAVILSGGDVIVGIIAFLVIFCILAAIKGVMKFITRDDGDTDKRKPSVSTNANAKTNIIFTEGSFLGVLNNVMRFLAAYSYVYPSNWYHFYITRKWECDGDITYGFLEFQVQLDSWANGTLFQDPEVEDYMTSIFTFDPQENTFTYSIRTGTSTRCAFPSGKINEMLHTYLSHYEANHPGVRFERHKWGAKYSNI